MTTDHHMQNLLAAVTEALMAEDGDDLDTIISQYAVPRTEVEGFIGIIQRLHLTLVGAAPSRRFVGRLKRDLIGNHRQGVVARIRYLPPRVQIAAGAALVAGFMLLTWRRMMDDTRREKQEMVTL